MTDTTKLKKDPRFIASVGFIGLLVIAGLILAGLKAFGGDDVARTPQPSNQGSSSATSSSVCGLPDGSQSVPTEALSAEWNLNGRFAAPVNKTLGPGVRSSGVATCFAHSPAGAVFAAANYLADSENPGVSPEALVEERVFNDENTKLAQEGAAGTTTDNDNPTTQIAAFRVDDATSRRVSVSAVVRFTEGPNTGAFAAITITLGWQNGDWKVVVPPSGAPPVAALSTLAGYTPWSGA